MVRYYDYSMHEAHRQGERQTPEGPLFGASTWSKLIGGTRARQINVEKKAFIRDYMGEASLNQYLQITRCMVERTVTIVSTDDWYLSIVGVAASFQG